MSSSTLILVRHAATNENLKRPYVLQGRSMNGVLSELGRQQAEAVAEALKGLPIAAVVSSPLNRARQTAAVIARHHHCDVRIFDALVEADIGQWEGLSWEEVHRRNPAEAQAFEENPAEIPYLGGESFDDAWRRAAPVLESLAAEFVGKTFVAVSHNVVNRALLAHWMGVPVRFARKIPQSNTGYSVVTFRSGKATVHTINSIAHLDGLLPD